MKEKKLFKAKPGAQFSPKKAQEYAEELLRIKEENGGVWHIDMIIEKAQDETSPLHDYYEWDDSRAALQFRRFQTRNLLNHIVEIVIDVKSGQEMEIPLTISVKRQDDEDSEPTRVYVYTREADEIDFAFLMDELRSELISMKKKIKSMEQFRAFYFKLEDAQKELELVSRRI